MKPVTRHSPLIALFLALLLPTTSAQAFKCIPLYGNWCGPDYPAGPALPPVDEFDAACMRHDFCMDSPGPEALCDRMLVEELNLLAARTGYLPRPLQWVEYVLRVKEGGDWWGMPMPTPWDAAGAMSSIMAPCW